MFIVFAYNTILALCAALWGGAVLGAWLGVVSSTATAMFSVWPAAVLYFGSIAELCVGGALCVWSYMQRHTPLQATSDSWSYLKRHVRLPRTLSEWAVLIAAVLAFRAIWRRYKTAVYQLQSEATTPEKVKKLKRKVDKKWKSLCGIVLTGGVVALNLSSKHTDAAILLKALTDAWREARVLADGFTALGDVGSLASELFTDLDFDMSLPSVSLESSDSEYEDEALWRAQAGTDDDKEVPIRRNHDLNEVEMRRMDIPGRRASHFTPVTFVSPRRAATPPGVSSFTASNLIDQQQAAIESRAGLPPRAGLGFVPGNFNQSSQSSWFRFKTSVASWFGGAWQSVKGALWYSWHSVKDTVDWLNGTTVRRISTLAVAAGLSYWVYQSWFAGKQLKYRKGHVRFGDRKVAARLSSQRLSRSEIDRGDFIEAIWTSASGSSEYEVYVYTAEVVGKKRSGKAYKVTAYRKQAGKHHNGGKEDRDDPRYDKGHSMRDNRSDNTKDQERRRVIDGSSSWRKSKEDKRNPHERDLVDIGKKAGRNEDCVSETDSDVEFDSMLVGSGMEHARPGFAILEHLHYVEIKAERNGKSVSLTGFPFLDRIFVPRHGVAECVNIRYVANGVEYPLGDDGYAVCKTMPDYTCHSVKANKPKMNLVRQFRAPKPSEPVVLTWIKGGVQKLASGTVGRTVMVGAKGDLPVTEFLGSSEEGACGGLYQSAVDGAIVGVHGIGHAVASVPPKFYPFNSEFKAEAVRLASSKPEVELVKPAQDTKHVAFHHKQINTFPKKDPFRFVKEAAVSEADLASDREYKAVTLLMDKDMLILLKKAHAGDVASRDAITKTQWSNYVRRYLACWAFHQGKATKIVTQSTLVSTGMVSDQIAPLLKAVKDTPEWFGFPTDPGTLPPKASAAPMNQPVAKKPASEPMRSKRPTGNKLKRVESKGSEESDLSEDAFSSSDESDCVHWRIASGSESDDESDF